MASVFRANCGLPAFPQPRNLWIRSEGASEDGRLALHGLIAALAIAKKRGVVVQINRDLEHSKRNPLLEPLLIN